MLVKGKIVLVTGSNRGIGKALVFELLNRDAKKVYAAARKTEQLTDFHDARVVPVQLDITNKTQIKEATEVSSDIDILINNAGAAAFASAFDGQIDLLERDMQVNYFGTLAMMRAFIPVLEKRKQSAIINVASIAAFVNFPFLGGYSASKAALYSITQGARVELANKGITVHSVNPGPIDTDMGKDVDIEKTSPEETAKGIIDGFEANEADVFPDPIGKGMFETWSKNYRDLENIVAESVKAA